MRQTLRIGYLAAVVCAMGLAGGCVGGTATDDETEPELAPLAVQEKDVLDALADSQPGQEIKVPGATAEEVTKALEDLDKHFKPADPQGKKIKADEAFYNSLSPKQKKAVDKIASEYEKKVQAGEVEAKPDPQGKLKPEHKGPKSGKGGGPSAGTISPQAFGAMEEPAPEPQHVVGDGTWSWSIRTYWTGIRLSVNHNFVYYLCANTQWLLDRLPLPGWIETRIASYACTLHTRDVDATGCSVFITWWGSVSISC